MHFRCFSTRVILWSLTAVTGSCALSLSEVDSDESLADQTSGTCPPGHVLSSDANSCLKSVGGGCLRPEGAGFSGCINSCEEVRWTLHAFNFEPDDFAVAEEIVSEEVAMSIGDSLERCVQVWRELKGDASIGESSDLASPEATVLCNLKQKGGVARETSTGVGTGAGETTTPLSFAELGIRSCSDLVWQEEAEACLLQGYGGECLLSECEDIASTALLREINADGSLGSPTPVPGVSCDDFSSNVADIDENLRVSCKDTRSVKIHCAGSAIESCGGDGNIVEAQAFSDAYGYADCAALTRAFYQQGGSVRPYESVDDAPAGPDIPVSMPLPEGPRVAMRVQACECADTSRCEMLRATPDVVVRRSKTELGFGVSFELWTLLPSHHFPIPTVAAEGGSFYGSMTNDWGNNSLVNKEYRVTGVDSPFAASLSARIWGGGYACDQIELELGASMP